MQDEHNDYEPKRIGLCHVIFCIMLIALCWTLMWMSNFIKLI